MTPDERQAATLAVPADRRVRTFSGAFWHISSPDPARLHGTMCGHIVSTNPQATPTEDAVCPNCLKNYALRAAAAGLEAPGEAL